MATRELQVINSVCKNKDIAVLFAENVDELFTGYKDVWDSIKSYYLRYRAVPDIEVIQERHPDLDEVSVKGATEHYLDSLKEEYVSNRMAHIMTVAAQKMDTDTAMRVLPQLQTQLAKLNRFTNSVRDLNIMDFEDAEEHYQKVREQAEALGGTPGIPTGISFIDSAYTSGFAPGDLVVVLGWTGRAKSLFTTLAACNAYQGGFKPMIVSLEMSPQKVRDRVFTIMGSGVFSNSSLTLGDVNIDDFRTFASKYEGRGDFIVMARDGVGEINPNVCQGKIDQHKPQIMVFDYAQLGSDNANSTDMTARMRNMSKEFKQLAVANNMAVVLISSATPDGSASIKEPPRVEDVAWSKQLAYDADLAFAVHKHDDSDLVEIVCRKNRNGPLFSGALDWDIDKGIIKEVFDF